MTTPQDIFALEAQRRQAMIAADVVTLSKLLADDVLWIHATARPDTKPGLLASIESKKTIYQAIDCSEETLRFYGDTAVVSGIADIKAQIAGEDRVLQNRFTIIWFRKAEGWQVVNWQSTTVRKPA
jgi:ketosteroid isomerase-like protein